MSIPQRLLATTSTLMLCASLSFGSAIVPGFNGTSDGRNDDGTFIVSDQEGHWTPENRINWVHPGKFYGYMMGFHEERKYDDFEPPVVWIHKNHVQREKVADDGRDRPADLVEDCVVKITGALLVSRL